MTQKILKKGLIVAPYFGVDGIIVVGLLVAKSFPRAVS